MGLPKQDIETYHNQFQHPTRVGRVHGAALPRPYALESRSLQFLF